MRHVLFRRQLEQLAKLGFTLNEGITIDDLIYSFDRESFEDEPFDLLFFALGSEVSREPWGRDVCSRIWNFDTECIYKAGDYVEILQRLCQVADNPQLLSDIRDSVDVESGEAWLKYSVDGQARSWDVEVNGDWADTITLTYVMQDIERDGRRFYSLDNGQAMILFYLDETTAKEVDRLSSEPLKPVVPD